MSSARAKLLEIPDLLAEKLKALIDLGCVQPADRSALCTDIKTISEAIGALGHEPVKTPGFGVFEAVSK